MSAMQLTLLLTELPSDWNPCKELMSVMQLTELPSDWNPCKELMSAMQLTLLLTELPLVGNCSFCWFLEIYVSLLSFVFVSGVLCGSLEFCAVLSWSLQFYVGL